MKRNIRSLLSFFLFYFAFLSAFSGIVGRLFIGLYANVFLLVFAAVSAYKSVFEYEFGLRMIFLFAAIAVITGELLSTSVSYSWLPSAESIIGLAIHIVVGFLALLISYLVADALEAQIRNRLTDSR